ncbi:hypothetical protein L873DRAFT_1262620 [Choiromyces venosus 120613-1]|uniref:Uncharacterized protein n=1 Tax=Choiromyces venosus 120613-1 TaxID=1336337 RepID=A0A3N4JFL9_9PEZI|nr:hypothetical protein L873DRAFT_1262620 [Choiromyces venosus 120613-1]
MMLYRSLFTVRAISAVYSRGHSGLWGISASNWHNASEAQRALVFQNSMSYSLLLYVLIE